MRFGKKEDAAFRKPAHGPSLFFRFSLLLAVVMAVSFGIYVAWSQHVQREEMERIALAEARVLKSEMNAIWDYVNENQVRINYDANGKYNFKGVYCTIAGKNIAQRFMRQTDYNIRFVRDSPRSANDVPDSYENKALSAFYNGAADEFYSVNEYEGQSALRYVVPLRIEGNCLECHGEPAGEKDVTGFLKEGYRTGDVGGAISIAIPLDAYAGDLGEAFMASIGFFAAIMLFVIATMTIALRRWVVRPLRFLEAAASRVGDGMAPKLPESLVRSSEVESLVSEFCDMEHRLSTLQQGLEDQVRDRTAELACANEKLKEESAFKTNFAAIMNHELKTPISAILAIAEIWERKGMQDATDNERLVREIRINCQSLLEMIENNVDAARVEMGFFDLVEEEVDLVDVIGDAVSVAAPLAEKKSIGLTSYIAPDVPVIRSDRNALGKILANLVSNALKYTDEGGSVFIGAAVSSDGRSVEIEVRDTGIGIAFEALDCVFERYVQSCSSSLRRRGGSGVGLSLVRELAGMLGGTVAVKSELGRGSSFSVKLPLREA